MDSIKSALWFLGLLLISACFLSKSVSAQGSPKTTAPVATAVPAGARAVPPADRDLVAKLETRLFKPSLSDKQVDRLLQALPHKPAVKKLCTGAAGKQERIIEFARRETDLNVRKATADVVEALDTAYRTTKLGKRLCALYAKHADVLVPHAWKRFRRDPHDLQAVAILVSAEPDRVLSWLERHGEKRDPLRFVLLRIREVPNDPWPARQLAKYSHVSFLRVVPEVFPAGSVENSTAAVRLVGHALLRRIGGSKADSREGLPKLQRVELIRRQVYVVRSQGEFFGDRLCAFKLDVTVWSGQGVRQVHPPFIRTAREYGRVGPKGMCPLPKLQLVKVHEIHWIQHSMTAPWWAKKFTPRAYWGRIAFGGRPKGQKQPRLLEPVHEPTTKKAKDPPKATTAPSRDGAARDLPADAPTVVVLSPRLPHVSTASLQARAVSMCDQIAERLDRSRRVCVVNRTELDRVLAERRLSSKPLKPMRSYDAMLRLRVQADELLPHAAVSLVDLSTGSAMGTWRIDWPVKDSRLNDLCRDVAARLGKSDRPAKGRLRLRLAGVERTQVRMASLGLRLENLFREALRSSRDILLVEHLEAGTSKEEALLLMVGFARLAGGRRFTPQADATLELRITESDAVGRTFQETPIELAFRLRRGGSYSGDWKRFSGTVPDYDTLARKTWKALSAALEKVDDDAGRKLLDDLALRRKQALTEVKAAEKVQSDLPLEQRLRAQIGHVNAALKLDPFCEEAAYRRIGLLWKLYGRHFTKYQGRDDVHELILAAAQYNNRFPQNADRSASVQDLAWLGVRMTPLFAIWRGQKVPITRKLRVLLDAMKQMVEMSTRGDPHRLSRGCPRFLPIVYRGMRQSGVSRGQREAWIDGILAGVRSQLMQLKKIRHLSRSNTVFRHHWMHLLAAELAAEDDRASRAQKLVAFIQKQLDDPNAPQVDQAQWPDMSRIMRKVLVKTDDAEALAKFDHWTTTQKPVRTIWFANLGRYGVYDQRKQLYEPQKIVDCRPGGYRGRPMSPLCAGGGYLYAIVARKDWNTIGWSQFRGTSSKGSSQTVVRIPLDARGRPKGKALRRPRRNRPGRVIGWDTLEVLPQPKVHGYLQVLCARFIDGKLYLGTKSSGLLVFDAKTKKWEVIDPSKGLPCWGVYSLHDWKDGLLFCFGEDVVGGAFVRLRYTFDPASGAIRILQKLNLDKGIYVHYACREIWEHEGKVYGLDRSALMPNLLADKPNRLRLPQVHAKGWPKGRGRGYEYNCAWVGERLFVQVPGGLLELDRAAKVKNRIFMGGGAVLPGFEDHWFVTRLDVPGEAPSSGVIVSDGRYLWFAGGHVIYDPQEQRWYGPLMRPVSAGYSVATPAGLWMGGCYSMWFIDREAYMAAARKAGRAIRSEQYVRRRDVAIAKLPAVPRARYLLALRKFDEAEDVLEAHLKEHKDDPLALLLMGMVQDVWGQNDLERAEACYRRLSEMKEPKPRFTGMYMYLHLLVHKKQWSRAQSFLNRIRSTFPRIYEDYDRDITRLGKRIRKAMADDRSRPDPGGTPA